MTARCRSARVYQRTGEPCPRCGRPVKRIVIGARSTHFCSWCQRLPSADRAGARAILRTMTGGLRQQGRRWTDLDSGGQGTVERPRRGRSGRDAPRRPGGPPRARRPVADVDPAPRGRDREVGTFMILDGVDAAIALGDRVGLVGPNGGGKTTLLRIAAGRDEPDRGEVHRKRGLSLGLLAQEAHFDAVFMAAPDLRTAVRYWRRASRRDGRRARRPWSMPAEPARRYTRSSSTASMRSAATRWTSASTRRCPGSASRAASGRSRRRRCRAASRRGRRWRVS